MFKVILFCLNCWERWFSDHLFFIFFNIFFSKRLLYKKDYIYLFQQTTKQNKKWKIQSIQSKH